MENKTFKLLRDLKLPINGIDFSRGALLFERDIFGISYENFRPDDDNKKLTIDLIVRHMETGNKVHFIKTIVVTKEGFKTDNILNSQDYNKYVNAKKEISDKIDELNKIVRDNNLILTDFNSTIADADEATRLELTSTIDELLSTNNTCYKEISELTLNLAKIVPVEPLYETILPYREVVEWFNNKGVIKDEHLSDVL